MKLVIDRRFWLRGEGSFKSFLYRPRDGKMCCLGFLAKACGARDIQIYAQTDPCEVDDVEWPGGLLYEDAGGEITHTPSAMALMRNNDCFSSYLSEDEREKNIRDEFKNLDIEVEFIN